MQPGDAALADEARRRRSVAEAGHRGDHETPRAALRDASPRVRATALTALGRLGRLTASDLASAMADPDSGLRRRACELAVGVPGADPLPLLADPDTTVVEAAAWALGEQQRHDAVARLARVATSHADPLCREAAVAALGAIGDAAGLPAILAGCSDKPAVRRRAVIALAPFDGPDVDAALRAALEDRDWQVRQAAEDLLASDGPAGDGDPAEPDAGRAGGPPP